MSNRKTGSCELYRDSAPPRRNLEWSARSDSKGFRRFGSCASSSNLQSLLVIAALVGISGCRDQERTSTAPAAPQQTALYVTGAAAQALDGDGRFVLPDAVVHPAGQVDEQHARDAAVAYARDFGKFYVGRWSEEHGANIDLRTLAPCDRALYAASAYMPLPSNVPAPERRVFGPHWIVPMCNGGKVQVAISLSALAIELQTERSQSKPMPAEHADFKSAGVPQNIAATAPFSPEAAVAQAYLKTGKRVTAVPELVMPPRPDGAVTARWRTTLESPVPVTGRNSRVTRDRQQLYVGFNHTFYSMGLLDADPLHILDSTPSVPAAPNRPAFSPTLAPNVPLVLELVTRGDQ